MGERVLPVTRWSLRQLGGRLRENGNLDGSAPGLGRRVDFRLLPAAVSSWMAAWGGTRLHADGAVNAALIAAGLGMLLAGVGIRARRAAVLPALALCFICAAAVLLAAGIHSGARTQGPIAEAVAGSAAVSAVIVVRGAPHAVTAGVGMAAAGGMLVLDAELVEATANGKRFGAAMPVVVLAGSDWSNVRVGEHIATAGRLKPADAGADVAASFAARTAPRVLGVDTGWSQQAGLLRSEFHRACGWLWPDAAGLLPGMVTGDRSSIPADLDTAMKRVGLTHLTAVSGANCTLILGGILYLARCLRAPRWVAATVAAAGLIGFVGVVGPDPSVLRAALMGVIGVLAMFTGRPRRIPALLAVAIVALLVLDPWLATNYAFVLSVLATVGLVLLGRRCSSWLGRWLPGWLAQAIAVPLAAQLFCAPVIVLLQPQLTLYAVPANMAAAPVVVLVTLVGTLGLPALLVPWAVPAFVAVSGAGAVWVGGVARFFSGLPGATVPWPEGGAGAALMAVLSPVSVVLLWGAVNRRRVRVLIAAVRARLPGRLQPLAGVPAAAAVAAVVGALLAWVLGETGLL
jgi:competence protein ComEC